MDQKYLHPYNYKTLVVSKVDVITYFESHGTNVHMYTYACMYVCKYIHYVWL